MKIPTFSYLYIYTPLWIAKTLSSPFKIIGPPDEPNSVSELWKNIFIFWKPKSELSLPAPIETKGIHSEGQDKPKVISNYFDEIQNAKNNLLDAYYNFNKINDEKDVNDEEYKKEYKKLKGVPSRAPGKKYWFAEIVKDAIAELICQDPNLVSQLMNKSVKIEEIYQEIQKKEITVGGLLGWDVKKSFKIYQQNQSKYQELQDDKQWLQFQSREQYNGEFVDALMHYVSHNLEAKRIQEGVYIPKELNDDDKKDIKNFIELVAKYKLNDSRYALSLQEHKGDAFGFNYALNQSLSPNLNIPNEIREKFGVNNMNEFKEKAIQTMGEQISQHISQGMPGIGKEDSQRVANFFKSQITTVTSLIANSPDENVFISKLNEELHLNNLTPLRMFLGHLWMTSRSVSQDNTLNNQFVVFDKRSNKRSVTPRFVDGDKIQNIGLDNNADLSTDSLVISHNGDDYEIIQ